jgi:uncharacterized membrane protein YkvA (DUF1232 family)
VREAGVSLIVGILASPMARSHRRGARLFRVLNVLPFLPLAGRAPGYARLLWALATDPRVPPSRKALLGIAGAYIVSPIDLIPEFIPVVGAFDDVVVMVLAIDVFLDGLPRDLLNEKLADLGMSPNELEKDLDRVRRIVPAPMRQLMLRVPDALDATAEFITDNGLDRRLRDALTRFRPTQEYKA